MDYPVWDTGVGHGVLMASIAVLHVFVSHFAIGGGLYLVWAERSARRRADEGHLAFVRRLSKVFALTTIVFGALTGVGIWFVIGLLNPAATEALIHNFVWAWAVEWTFFLVEILAAILYAKGWDRLDAKTHERVGWVYFAAAFLSLVVINGIVTFMLTPGKWVQTGAFWDGFLNPTYLSSLALRTAICVLMAGLFGLLVATGVRDAALRGRLVRGNGLWGLAGLVAAFLALLWYRADLPQAVWLAVGTRLSIPAAAVAVLLGLSATLLLLFALAVALPRGPHRATAVALMLAGLGWFGAYEWFRESVRKPWVIHGYMYANGVEASRAAGYGKDGMLASMPVRTGRDGEDLWLRACRSCHTLDGYNPVKPAFDNTDSVYIEGALRGLHEMRGLMPAFAGNAAEQKALAAWLWHRVDQRPVHQRHALEGAALGRRVYEQRCGRCHVDGGWKDNRESIKTMTAEEIDALIGEELLPEMPVFSGDETDRKALVDYLATWSQGASR